MLPLRTGVFLLLVASSTVALLAQSSSQTPAQRYRNAERIFKSHIKDDFFLHDDSAAAIEALATMWAASEDAAIRRLAERREATATDIGAALCGLWTSSSNCGEHDDAREEVISLGSNLFVVSLFSGETGTVFIVGLRHGTPSLLWSISAQTPQERDPRGLLAAWRADRAGGSCRTKDSGHEPGTCGPLYASVGALPSDAEGRPRFYVDAGYAQSAGATIGKQTSVWRWDGDTARLLWIGLHAVMVEQNLGIEFADGVLTVGEKEQFRSFFGCGSCEARQVAHRLRITPTAVQDLGTFSATPELDLVDELFWRLANGRQTADIASEQVSRFLKPQILAAKSSSRKIDPDYFTTGMLMDVSVTQLGDLKRLCFTVDGDIGRLYFTIQEVRTEGAKLVHVAQPSGAYRDCPKSVQR